MGKVCEVGIFLDSEQVMQMAIQLDRRNHVNMTLPTVGDDVADLIFAEASIGVQQRVAIKLDSRFRVEVELVPLPLGEKIELPFYLAFSAHRAFAADIHQRAAKRERGPVTDLNIW